jgi:hypothetical protein
MGFSNIDHIISAVTQSGKFRRVDFNKGTGANAGAIGKWIDLTMMGGMPSEDVHGTYVKNGLLQGGFTDWTFNSWGTYWKYTPTGYIQRVAGAGVAGTMSQNTACVAGTTYSVTYTISTYGGSGSFQVSLGGTNGTARTANGTYREDIVCVS